MTRITVHSYQSRYMFAAASEATLHLFTSRLPVEMATSTFADRPLKTLVLFDVDGTLTPARQVRIWILLVCFATTRV